LHRRLARARAQGPQPLGLLFDLCVELRLMIVIESKGRVDLGQRKVWMLFVDGVRTPAVGQVVKDDFDDLDISLVDPRDAPGVADDVMDGFSSNHAQNLPAFSQTCNPCRDRRRILPPLRAARGPFPGCSPGCHFCFLLSTFRFSPLPSDLGPLVEVASRQYLRVSFFSRQRTGRTGGKLARPNEIGHKTSMKTLAEIERAAEQLPGAEQTELLYFLVQRLDETNLPLPEPRQFSVEQLQQWMDEDEADMRRFKAGA